MRLIAFLPLAFLAAGPAAAQQDPLIGAIQQMLASFEPACQAGDAMSCGAMDYVQGLGNQMDMALQACNAGNQDACAAFQSMHWQMESDYGQWAQSTGMAGGQDGGGQDGGGQDGGGMTGGFDPNAADPLGQTHDQRMAAIAQFGAQSTADFNSRMTAMDQQQSQFLGTITGN